MDMPIANSTSIFKFGIVFVVNDGIEKKWLQLCGFIDLSLR